MNRLFTFILSLILLAPAMNAAPGRFVSVSGTDLVRPDGSKLYIRGTNLGNWLNPEGYMFGFSKTNSPHMIDLMFRQLVGSGATDRFWREFKDNYITRADIDYIAATGANTVRLPFNYKLFTDEDYMGSTGNHDTYARIDSLVEWCRADGLYLILDMHDCPAGQTGDNIDDSYGYPWLFEDAEAQQLFLDIWTDIARHYKDEPVILGYELMNEPIAHYFDDKAELNARLEPLMKRGVEAIRSVDPDHIILLGGAQWNGNFEPFTDWTFADNIMYTCHRYGGDATRDAIASIIEFRDRTGLPMYMGEIGHNSMQWHTDFCNVLEANNIGYTFWPYKKKGDSCMMGITAPEGWQAVIDFAEADRSSYSAIRKARPDVEASRRAMADFVRASRLEACTPQTDYIRSIKLNVP